MKYLKGFKKCYFKLTIIAMYSTWHKLYRELINYVYHISEQKELFYNKSPPTYLFFKPNL